MKNLSKKCSVFLLLAVCLFWAASCKDDDDNGNNNGEKRKGITMEMMAQQDAVECVLLSLAGVEREDTSAIEFEGKRFEPTIGKMPDESQPSIRAVQADDEIEAALKFQALVSDNDFVKETDDGYVIDLTKLDYRLDGRKQSLGKLTYHRCTDGSCLAYADVDIECIPLLRRINYLSKEQWDSNGWDEYGSWESPCLFGQVWYNNSQGLYYVCVLESRSDTDGWLINVQPGRSNMYNTVASNEGDKGAWEPQHPVSKVAIEHYVKLCIDGQYYDIKQELRKRFPNKIFPPVPIRHGKGEECKWKDYGYLHVNDGDDGFGTSQKGYGHWVGDIGNGKIDDYLKPGEGPEVLIIRDGWESDYAGWPARNYRKQEVYCMAPRAKYDSKRYWHTKKYVYWEFENSDYCDWMDQKYPYTANGYSFRGTPPSGFGTKPVFDPADEGF